jgi:hypothetical protein
MVGAMILSVAISSLLPVSIFGLERIDFRTSLAPIVADKEVPLSFPEPRSLQPILAVATPGLRYLFWLASDLVRTRQLSAEIGSVDSPLCKERLGYVGVEISDCYFLNLRRMANVAPLVSPYFALYFETIYRQEVASQFKLELDRKLGQSSQGQQRLDDDSTRKAEEGSTLLKGFASTLLMLSNQIELLEPGPMFVERTHFLKPSALLHAYGSPEFPLVEAGQDIQRIGLVDKLVPVFELQLEAVRNYLETNGRTLGADQVTVEAEVRDMQTRIDAVKRDPLMIGN